MIKKVFGSILLGMLGITPVLAQSNDGVTNFQASANIENTCLISADNINFGQVYAPLTNQGSQSEMRVQCSNKASYTIGLAYGGIYGAGSGSGENSEYSVAYIKTSTDRNVYYVYDKSGTQIGHMVCGFSGNFANKTYISNETVASLYGFKGEVAIWTKNDTTGCATNGTVSGTTPVGWVGDYNLKELQAVRGGTAYAYGMMTGLLKGDMLAYKITIPGDITKVWNSGNNSYTATGTGTEQVIDMKAQIVPGNSSSFYPAQDMYMDTVTAVIAY